MSLVIHSILVCQLSISIFHAFLYHTLKSAVVWIRLNYKSALCLPTLKKFTIHHWITDFTITQQWLKLNISLVVIILLFFAGLVNFFNSALNHFHNFRICKNVLFVRNFVRDIFFGLLQIKCFFCHTQRLSMGFIKYYFKFTLFP